MSIGDAEQFLDRHRDRFRRLIEEIVAEEAGEDPFALELVRFRALDDGAKARMVERAAIIGRERIDREIADRSAAWIVLLGDDVVASGADPAVLPDPETVLGYGGQRGLVAYLFEAPLIEELPPADAAWSPIEGSDRYPTLPLAIVREGAEANVLTADLDTGSHATLLDADLVGAPQATWFGGRHLGREFVWSPCLVQLELSTIEGGHLRRSLPVRQVQAWKTSSFVRVNPQRQVLAGRDLLRAFSLTLVLRASDSRTEIASGS